MTCQFTTGCTSTSWRWPWYCSSEPPPHPGSPRCRPCPTVGPRRPHGHPQVWLGLGHARILFVGAHLEPPNAFAFAPSGFRRPTTTAFASIIDYTFGPSFDGWWLGSGVEVWQNSIEHVGVATNARWTSTVLTVGGGYIWRFAGNLFLDPWVGAHLVLNPQRISLGGVEPRLRLGNVFRNPGAHRVHHRSAPA